MSIRPLPFKFITFIYYGYITLVYFSMFLRAICKFLPYIRVVLALVIVLFWFVNSLRNSKQTFWRGKALFSLDKEIPKLSFSWLRDNFLPVAWHVYITFHHRVGSNIRGQGNVDDMRVNFSSAWKANIFTHTGIANRVLREEISGLKKKTYCVEDNILVFVNIFSDVKFKFDCLF